MREFCLVLAARRRAAIFITTVGLLWLAGCATTTPLPLTQPVLVADLPLTLHVTREQDGDHRDWLLIVQPEPATSDTTALRWTLFDPLGMPLARQQLRHDGWHRDGMLPPNPEARALFAALLFALTPASALATSYAGQSWSLAADGTRRLAPDWQLGYRAPLHITLERTGGLRYRVAPLSESPP